MLVAILLGPRGWAEEGQGLRVHGTVEGLGASLPSGTPAGSQDFFLFATPLLGLSHEHRFALELGARLRFRLLDAAPEQRPQDHAGVLRHEDWDERSDFGQLVQELRVGTEGGPFFLQAGPVALYSLGRGYLLHRYQSRTTEDYHPSTVNVAVQSEALRLEAFASDLLAARIVAFELLLDLGSAFGGSPAWQRRFLVGLQAAHDFGRSGVRTPDASLVHADLDVVLHRGAAARVAGYAGVGTRLGVEEASPGAVGGVSLEGSPGSVQLGAKAELRYSGGGFRHGYFGSGYELSRLSVLGLAGPPQALLRWPTDFTVAAEVGAQLGAPVGGDSPSPGLWLSASGERTFYGESAFDLAMATQLFEGRVVAQLRAGAVGLGVAPRLSLEGDVRYRIAPSLYLLGEGGTSFFPQPDGSLVRGVFVGAGAGVDLGR